MRPLNVLFLASAHNSLSQRSWIALTELGHDVAVAVVESGAQMEAAVAARRPDLIVHEARHCFVHKLGAPCAVPTAAVEPGSAAIRRAGAR
jgi:hypothetical protein